jgi:hypothetical protein
LSAPPFFSWKPTAQQLPRVRQRAAKSPLASPSAVPPGSGADTFDHMVPFQCRTSFRMAPPLMMPYLPTAQQFLAEEQKAPLS